MMGKGVKFLVLDFINAPSYVPVTLQHYAPYLSEIVRTVFRKVPSHYKYTFFRLTRLWVLVLEATAAGFSSLRTRSTYRVVIGVQVSLGSTGTAGELIHFQETWRRTQRVRPCSTSWDILTFNFVLWRGSWKRKGGGKTELIEQRKVQGGHTLMGTRPTTAARKNSIFLVHSPI